MDFKYFLNKNQLFSHVRNEGCGNGPMYTYFTKKVCVNIFTGMTSIKNILFYKS